MEFKTESKKVFYLLLEMNQGDKYLCVPMCGDEGLKCAYQSIKFWLMMFPTTS